MPTAKIHVHEHRCDERRPARLGEAVQGALESGPEGLSRGTTACVRSGLAGST
jgi:hypothetical protein